MATERQLEVLALIYYSITQRGVAPTFRELRLLLEVTSNNGVNDFLRRLEDAGLLARQPMEHRGLMVTPAGIDALGPKPFSRVRLLSCIDDLG